MHNRGGHMTRRILCTYRAATSDETREGLQWYEAAHTFAVGLSERYGITVLQAAGIIAALSPQKHWDMNMRIADQLCRERRAPVVGDNLTKALRILDGEAPEGVLGGFKVRNFYDNIASPTTSVAVTVDRHAVDIALGFVGDDASRKFLDRALGYNIVAEAYRSAAGTLDLRPHQVQAVTWVTWRNTKQERMAA